MRQEDRGVAPALPRRARKRLAAVGPCRLFDVSLREGTKTALARRGGLASQGWLNIRTDCEPLEVVRRRYRFDPFGVCPHSERVRFIVS
jgi:hypothetical protein